MSETGLRRLALTPGEPAGVGPELCVRIAQRDWPAGLVAFADPDLLHAAATRLDLPLELIAHDPGAPPAAQAAGSLGIVRARQNEFNKGLPKFEREGVLAANHAA